MAVKLGHGPRFLDLHYIAFYKGIVGTSSDTISSLNEKKIVVVIWHKVREIICIALVSREKPGEILA